MDILTQRSLVSATVGIWAIPLSRYAMECAEPGTHPFNYKLVIGNPWEMGATKVHEELVTLTMPAGINLLAAAVETLRSNKEEIMKDAMERMKEIDSQIQQLLMLSGPADSIQGEVVNG